MKKGIAVIIKVQFINHNKIDEKSFTFGELLFEQKLGIEN